MASAALRRAPSLTRLLEPRGIAVVGASPGNEVAMAALANFASLGYPGDVAGIHPRHTEVAGVRCAPSLADLDFVPDAVIVCVGRDRVLGAVEDAAAAGSAGAVVFAMGFGEAGEDGRERQRRMVVTASEAGMVILGPNCQGAVNFAARAPLSMEIQQPYRAGSVGLVAQSGGILTAVTNNARGVRWRSVASTGNEAMVTAGDLLGWMVDDEGCRVACLFLEAIRDPEHFFAQCDRARERDMPVVVMKTGRTEASTRAAEAHSGALALPDRLIDARFERHGVIRVPSLEDLLETAIALQTGARPARGTIATITSSGGQIGLALDAVSGAGVEHPPLSPETVAFVRGIFPPDLPASNPIDYWGMHDVEGDYPRLVRALAEDPAIDIVVPIVDQSEAPSGDGRWDMQIATALQVAPEAPALIAPINAIEGGSPPERVEQALESGVALLSGIDRGMAALARLSAYGRGLAEPRRPLPRRPPDPALAAAVRARGAPFGGTAALDVLRAAGVPVVETRAVRGEDALEAAEALGYPVVLKVADEGLTHKTEVGGVVTGIAGPVRLREEIARLERAGFEELLLQPTARGVELLLGLTRHEELGTFLVVGLGGIWAELLDDVVLAPAGLAEGEAAGLLARLAGRAILDGARGTAPVSRPAVVAAIEAFDGLALALGDSIAALDLNPLLAGPDGCWAVDAAIMPAA